MLYWFLYYWFWHGLRIWFRKIFVHYEAPIPDDAPVIFACTHPNSALDYVWLPLITKKEAHVLVRGDVFEKSWLNKLFRALWMLPVYRIQDGIGTIKGNEQSFKECYDLFDQKGWVLVFTEGICIQEKTLQPLKKGTARLALDYLTSRKGKEIYVVPMANNYTRFRQMRASVMTNFGKPIRVSEYLKLSEEHPNRAYQQLTKDIEAGIQRIHIHENNYHDDSWTEKALHVLRLNRWPESRKWIEEQGAPYEEEQALVRKMNDSNESVLSEEWKRTYERLKPEGRQEGLLKASARPDMHWMILFSLSIFIFLGNVFFFIPYKVAHWLVREKIKNIIFESTVMTIGSVVIFMLQFFVLLAILLPTLGFYGFVICCSILAIGLIYADIIDDYRMAWYNTSRLKHREEHARLYNDLLTQLKEPNKEVAPST